MIQHCLMHSPALGWKPLKFAEGSKTKENFDKLS